MVVSGVITELFLLYPVVWPHPHSVKTGGRSVNVTDRKGYSVTASSHPDLIGFLFFLNNNSREARSKNSRELIQIDAETVVESVGDPAAESGQMATEGSVKDDYGFVTYPTRTRNVSREQSPTYSGFERSPPDQRRFAIALSG